MERLLGTCEGLKNDQAFAEVLRKHRHLILRLAKDSDRHTSEKGGKLLDALIQTTRESKTIIAAFSELYYEVSGRDMHAPKPPEGAAKYLPYVPLVAAFVGSTGILGYILRAQEAIAELRAKRHLRFQCSTLVTSPLRAQCI
jgi:hypothetical protein